MLTCQITLPDSPHPVIISKNPGFRALYLAGQNEFRFFSFNKYKKIFFFIFGCWLLPKKLAFAWKIMVLPSLGAASPYSPPGSYAYGENVRESYKNVNIAKNDLQ